MQMKRKIESLSLPLHTGQYDQWPRHTKLLHDGRPTATMVPGYVIEAQYRCDDGYLIVTSYDCPFEEANEFLLLSQTFRVLASTSLGQPYASYWLYAHWPVSPNELRLHYGDTLFFTLTINQRAGLFGTGRRLELTEFTNLESDFAAKESLVKYQQRCESQGG